MVGAVVVRQGRIVGEGYHKKAGGPHGEILALRKAGPKARNASLYLNLEPCCHQGRTPPCTDSLIEKGIREVYVGMRDPNPQVSGKGIRRLRRAGIRVHQGILKKDCEKLNEIFIKYIQTGRPYVILKSAISLDGKIATRTGQSQWITGPQARRQVHQLRNRVDAILVGAGTVLKDNPHLTTRLKGNAVKHPVRVILDGDALTPVSAHVYKNATTQRVIHVTSRKASAARLQKLERIGVEVCVLKDRKGIIPLSRVMEHLGKEELTSLLIEGGGQVNEQALRENVVDKIELFMAPLLIGGKEAPGFMNGLGVQTLQQALAVRDLSVTPVGKDWMLEGYL